MKELSKFIEENSNREENSVRILFEISIFFDKLRDFLLFQNLLSSKP